MKDHEHDGPKSSRGNHADIKRPTALRALSTVEANEKWRPYSLLPLDLSTRAIFHFVTIRKPLWLSRSSLIYEPTTIPFVIRVPYLSTLFISPLSPHSFFIFPYRSGLVSPDTRVPPRHLAHASKRVHFCCTRSIEPCSIYLIAWRRSLLPRINLLVTNLASSQSEFRPKIDPNRFDKRNLRGECA